MQYFVLGVRSFDFTSNDGSHVQGYSVYLAQPFSRGEGMMPVLTRDHKPFFFSKRICDRFGWTPAPSQRVEISSTLVGGIDSISLIE